VVDGVAGAEEDKARAAERRGLAERRQKGEAGPLQDALLFSSRKNGRMRQDRNNP
jgi:hypothetical protein